MSDAATAALVEVGQKLDSIERKLDALIAEIVTAVGTATDDDGEPINCAMCAPVGRRVANCPACGGTGR